MKTITIFFLTTILTFSHVIGQDSSIHNLDQLSVTANINPTDIKKTARNVSIIDSKTIKEAPVKTLDGILQYALNVDVRSRSPFGVQADISIRGGHYDQTLIMIDGIKMNDPQTGHHSMNLPIPITQIEKIEILQGGASRVFGPSAFSGIINIITKKENTSKLDLQLIRGEHKLTGLNGFANLHLNKYNISVSSDILKSDGYAYNTAFEKKSSSLTIDRSMRRGFVKILGGVFSNDFGASNFYSPKFFDQYEEVSSKFIAIQYLINLNSRITSTINASYRKHNDLYDFNNFLKNKTYNSVNFHETNVIDIEWKTKIATSLGKTSFGLESRIENVFSNRLGNALSEKVKVKNFEVYYDKFKSRSNHSAYFEHQVSLKNFTIVGGTLLNYNSQFGFKWYPGIDASLRLDEKSNIYASINSSTRYPTFTEMYLKGATVIGDPNLKPEQAISYEIGHKFQSNFLSFTASVFYRQTKDAIDKIARLGQAIPTMENIDDINMLGIEFVSKIDLRKLLNSNKYLLMKSIDLNYAYLKADRKENGFQSFYTLNYLNNKMCVGLNLKAFQKINLSIWYTNKYRVGSYQLDAQSPIISYKPINLLDIRAAYDFKKLGLFVDVNNLLNQEYFEFGFVAQPKRWLSSGIKLSI